MRRVGAESGSMLRGRARPCPPLTTAARGDNEAGHHVPDLTPAIRAGTLEGGLSMNSFGKTVLGALSLLLVVGLCTASCGSSFSPPAVDTWPTLGEIYQMMLDSSAPDTDGDSIPDDVELDPILGTDPNRSDTDRDGMNDTFEVFGPSFLFVVTDGEAGSLDRDERLKDQNGNGEHAAVDPEETSEDLMVDDDDDGVFSYLEYYGYAYDWTTAEFVPWTEADRQAHPDEPWCKSDPLQTSTDQDAYPDGMELSSVLMDVAVGDPGNHPLVPAYPNIVVRLEGYTVTLNDEITYARGGSLNRGQSWSREVTQTNSHSQHYDWEVGVEAGYDNGFVGKVHSNFNWGFETTNTTSTSVATGTTVNTEIDWNKARSYNPTEAAHIKLFLKVENAGTAPASNIIPTLNLRIGGSNVVTFEQGNFQINMLMPGETYPEGDSVYWVVDAIDTGTGVDPLALTQAELKALESGAPVTIAVTQMLADVMLMKQGAWERVSDINEFLARCRSVSANIYADLGDGEFIHQSVFAEHAATAPAVTLRDALVWAFGAVEEGGEVYLDRRLPDGSVERTQISDPEEGKGWSVHVDAATIEPQKPIASLLDLQLNRDSHVELIAPRASDTTPPNIYSAYAVPLEDGYDVIACASDYDGINTVVFRDKDDSDRKMEPDGRGPWFFSCRVPAGYEFVGDGAERVVVTSVNQNVPAAQQPVDLIHTIQSEPPVISRLIYDGTNRRLQAKVEPGGLLAEDALAWVRLYHPTFLAVETGEERNGYITMNETIFWFEEPDIFECTLPHGWQENMRLVASTAGGKYTAVEVADVTTLLPYGEGWFNLYAKIDWTATDEVYVEMVDIDDHTNPKWSFEVENSHFDDGWPSDGINYLRNTAPDADIYLRSACDDNNDSNFMLGCQFKGVKVADTGGKSADVYFVEMTKDEVLALSPSFVDGGATLVGLNQVYAFETTDGRYGKLLVTYDDRWDSKTYDWDKCSINCNYVLFRTQGDGVPPPSLTYTADPAYYTVSEEITPNEPVLTGDGDPVDRYSVTPALPSGLSLNEFTGVITGTPTVGTAAQAHEITGTNTAGSTIKNAERPQLCDTGQLSDRDRDRGQRPDGDGRRGPLLDQPRPAEWPNARRHERRDPRHADPGHGGEGLHRHRHE
jgi:hypothetical protein